jgi:hypothetical protein
MENQRAKGELSTNFLKLTSRFALIRYSNEEEARQALQLHAKNLDKKHIFCVSLYGNQSDNTDGDKDSTEFKPPVCTLLKSLQIIDKLTFRKIYKLTFNKDNTLKGKINI